MYTSFKNQKSEVRSQRSDPALYSVLSPQSSVLSRRRRGSILIMVIALLVMLALITTAYLSTARNDTAAASQNSVNTQVDLVGQGVSDMAVNSIVNGLFDTSATATVHGYRTPPSYFTPSSNYSHCDSPVTDLFLGTRVPILTGANYQWEWISGPLNGAQFEDPVSGTKYCLGTTTPAFSDRRTATIGFSATTPIYPTLTVISGGPFIAADADGDGIADSGLFKIGTLPGPQFSGITFYAGARIIDNNSAINLSTAWQSTSDYDTATGAAIRNNRLNPASIGLNELIQRYFGATDYINFRSAINNGNALNNYRFGGAPANTASWSPGTDLKLANYPTPNPPYADYSPVSPNTILNNSTASSNYTAVSRSGDFTFVSQMDWFWTMLGRRLNNPGINNPIYNVNSNPSVRFQALPLSDTASLAYRFCLRPSSSAAGMAEQYFNAAWASVTPSLSAYDPVYSGAANLAYPSTSAGVASWFSDNFNYNTAPAITLKSLRTLFVTRNPVSNAIPAHTPVPVMTPVAGSVTMSDYTPSPTQPLWDSATAYVPGQVVTYTDTTLSPAIQRTFQCLLSNTNTAPTFAHATTWKVFSNSYAGVYNTANRYRINDVVTYYNTTGVAPGVSDAVSLVALVDLPTAAPTAPTLTTADTNWAYFSWSASHPVKTNINKASFAELWRAYWNVMADVNGGLANSPFTTTTVLDAYNPTNTYQGNKFNPSTPFTPLCDAANPANPQRMFRSSIRDNRINNAGRGLGFNAKDQLVLRAAIAAANAEAMRTAGSVAATVHTIYLPAMLDNVSTTVKVDIYGSKPQPFITEIYVNNDTTKDASNNLNSVPYIAFELYNPYGTALTVNLADLRVHTRPTGTTAGLTDAALDTTTPTATYTVPAGGYLAIDNCSASGGGNPSVPIHPAGATITAGATHLNFGANLLGNELVLTSGGGTANPIPLDTFDFSGINASTGPSLAEEWHYCRDTTSGRWVYPGRYDGSITGIRQQGVDYNSWDPTNANPSNPSGFDEDPWATSPPTGGITLGAANGGSSFVNGSTVAIKSFAIQLFSNGFPSFNPIASGGNQFPFGGFMRDGDILQVPFIGAYNIYNGATLYESNAITSDASMAEDTDIVDDDEEQIGRFCPINSVATLTLSNGKELSEFNPIASDQICYGWAGKLFDYLTVQTTHDDTLPDVDPVAYATPGNPIPHPIMSSASTVKSAPTEQGYEDTTGVDGLVNINTAPFPVLLAIPWTNNPATNRNVANNISNYRKGFYGLTGIPRFFHNIFELNQVIGATNFRDALGNTSSTTSFKTFDNGDFSPANGTTPTLTSTSTVATIDPFMNEFEGKFLMMTGVSNLITTRSDTFTVYIVVEGWDHAGGVGGTPNRVIQKRYAFLVDRTGVTSGSNRKVKITPIPTN